MSNDANLQPRRRSVDRLVAIRRWRPGGLLREARERGDYFQDRIQEFRQAFDSELTAHAVTKQRLSAAIERAERAESQLAEYQHVMDLLAGPPGDSRDTGHTSPRGQ